MNKRGTALTALLLAALLLLGACSQADERPQPTTDTVEAASNHIGLRFRFTLRELNSLMNTAIGTMEADQPVACLGAWTVLERGLADSSGVKYTSYTIRRQDGTLTAAVEDESGRVINIGAGCLNEQLGDSAFREGFLSLAALLAEQAGGYTDADQSFLRELIGSLLDGEEDEFYCGNVRYTRSRDDNTVVVILSPCSADRAQRDGLRAYGEKNEE